MQTRRGFAGALLAGTVAWFGLRLPEPADPGRELIWTTKDGQQIKVRDMTDDHLRNCIHYLNRRYGEVSAFRTQIPAMWIQGAYGGDAGKLFPEYPAMLREATRRKLSWV